jgi:hypothetical protein
MIVEPKISAVIAKMAITPFETTMQGSDRFLRTIVDGINGKSSGQEASQHAAGIGLILRARLRYSVSDHIIHSQFLEATTSRAIIAVVFSDFRIRPINTAARELVLKTPRIMLPN